MNEYNNTIIHIDGWDIQPLIVKNKISYSEIEKLATCLVRAVDIDTKYYDIECMGKLVIHPGRRGIVGNLYFIGRWVDTFELFHLSCYRFHQEEEYEILTHRNPMMCSHDVDTVTAVLKSFSKSVEGGVINKSVFFE